MCPPQIFHFQVDRRRQYFGQNPNQQVRRKRHIVQVLTEFLYWNPLHGQIPIISSFLFILAPHLPQETAHDNKIYE